MVMTPCKSPSRCGVINHRAGTIAKCQNGSAKTSVGSTASLNAPPVPATGKSEGVRDWTIPESSVAQPFPFDEESVHELTHGECWYLAHVIHTHTGLPFSFIYDEYDEVQHVGVELPDGKMIDIEGVWEPREWGDRWRDELDAAGIFGVHAESFYEGDKLPSALREYNPIIEGFTYGEDETSLIDVAHQIIELVRSEQ